MKIKILQLNTFGYKYFPAMVEYINQIKPDIINLQELAGGNMLMTGDIKDYWALLKSEIGLDQKHNYVLGKRFEVRDKENSYFANGVISGHRIIDHTNLFDSNLPSFQKYSLDSEMVQTVIYERKELYYTVFDMPVNFVVTLIEINGRLIRNITTHLNVSYGCQETRSHIKSVQFLLDYLKNSKDLPTIFSGDLNIHPKSATVDMLWEYFDSVDMSLGNTLNPRVHRAFQKDLPNGVQVDYVFTKGFGDYTCQVLDKLDLSDHLGVLAEVEI